MTTFLLLLFANKSKTSTCKISQQKHRFVYKLYRFCCCAYQNKQKINRHFLVMLGPCLNLNRIYCHGSRIYFQCFENNKEAEKVEVNYERLKNRKKKVFRSRESNWPSDLTLMKTRSFIID
jgi:hypothetical protein